MADRSHLDATDPQVADLHERLLRSAQANRQRQLRRRIKILVIVLAFSLIVAIAVLLYHFRSEIF
jgi:hypothetical protein